MKLLVSTALTQGDVAGDYDYCVPGELLWLPMVCDDDLRDPAGGCGCGRGFGGLTSHRATTTGEVVDRDYTDAELRLAVRTSLSDQGWLSDALPAVTQREILDEVVGQIRYIAETLPVGSVVRRRVDQVEASVPPRRAEEPPPG
jgi:hypothetical protein